MTFLSLPLSFYATCISSPGIRNWHKLAQTPCPVLRAVLFFGARTWRAKKEGVKSHKW